MIHKTYYMSCSACNRFQAPAYGETKRECAIDNAKLGWSRRVVPSGSTWDICPKCSPNFEHYALGELPVSEE